MKREICARKACGTILSVGSTVYRILNEPGEWIAWRHYCRKCGDKIVGSSPTITHQKFTAEGEYPEIVIGKDYDGYFQGLVERMVKAKMTGFQHRKIVVEAVPFLPDACQYQSHEDVLYLQFYSALRAGFGELGPAEPILEVL
jgi:hypothetical protein